MLPHDFAISVAGVLLKGQIYMPQAEGKIPVTIVCHGIPGGGPPDPSDPGYPALARRLSGEGILTVIFNFRGTGASEGDFDIMGWADDLQGILDHVLQLPQADAERIAIMGFSGGAAVAVYVAAHDPRIKAVVLLACPAYFKEDGAQSMLEHARRVGIIRNPGFPRSVEEWWEGFMEISPVRWIDLIAPRPVVLIHGDSDELIPVPQARELFHRAGEPKELLILEKAGHRLRREERAIALATERLKRFLLSR